MALPPLPTTEEIRNRIIADIESLINQNTPLLFKAFNRVIAYALSFVFTLLYKYGVWAYQQIFTITQGEESLIIKGDQYNISRGESVATQIEAGATGTDPTTIPQGQTFRGNANGLVYSVQTSVDIASSVATVALTCLTSGTQGNLLVGDTLTILEPIDGLDNAITVSAITVEGEGQEDIEDYRADISTREKRPPQGGALVDYILWAREVEGITRAFAFGHREESAITEGHVSVYPLNDDETSRIPSAGKLAEVLSYIDDPTRAPTQCVAIDVLAMTEREFTVDITALSPDTSDIRTAISANVASFLLEREPQQFLDQIDIKSAVSRSGIESICIQSGADSVTLDLYIDGTVTPIELHTLDYFELAILLGSVTFP